MSGASRQPFAATRDGVRVAVRLTPRAGRNRIDGLVEDADGAPMLKISVTAAPERGKANGALVKLLAKAWRLPKTTIGIATGATSRRKTLLVRGDPQKILGRLEEWNRQRHDG
ncbi:MAG: DUF167 family protein [Alphaproteobacteria bacterium]